MHICTEEIIYQDEEIWIENVEVLSRGQAQTVGNDLNAHGVMDYDLWRVMNMLKGKINIPIQ